MKVRPCYTDSRTGRITHVLELVYGDPKHADKTDEQLLKLLDKIK